MLVARFLIVWLLVLDGLVDLNAAQEEQQELPADCLLEDSFSVQVLMDVVGRPGAVTLPEIALMEDAVRDSYNDNLVNCNGIGFVRIDQVNIRYDAVDAFGDDIDTSLNAAHLTREFTWMVNLQVTCRGCNRWIFAAPDEQLGEEDLRFLQENQHAATWYNHRILTRRRPPQALQPPLNQAICDCSLPLAEDFVAAMNSAIRQLSMQPSQMSAGDDETSLIRLSSVDLILAVTELVPIEDCPLQSSTFTSSLLLRSSRIQEAQEDGDGSNNLQQDDEEEMFLTRVLERGILESYNHLNALGRDTCDIFFRTVENVTVDSTCLVQEQTQGGNTASFWQFLVQVEGSCKGSCGAADDTTVLLFDDDATTAVEASSTAGSSRARGLLQQGVIPECFCPVNSQAVTPSLDSFLSVLNEYLQQEQSLLLQQNNDDMVDPPAYNLVIDSVEEVDSIRGIPEGTTQFTGQLILVLELNIETASAEGLLELQTVVQESFNQVAEQEQVCDEQFRRWTQATINLEESFVISPAEDRRHLQATPSPTSTNHNNASNYSTPTVLCFNDTTVGNATNGVENTTFATSNCTDLVESSDTASPTTDAPGPAPGPPPAAPGPAPGPTPGGGGPGPAPGPSPGGGPGPAPGPGPGSSPTGPPVFFSGGGVSSQLLLEITGECRGCTSNSRLFDDTRRLLQEGRGGDFQQKQSSRFLQDTCSGIAVCPVNAERRYQTQGEYQAALQPRLQSLGAPLVELQEVAAQIPPPSPPPTMEEPVSPPSVAPAVMSTTTSAPSDSFSVTEEPTTLPSAAPVVSSTSAPSDSFSITEEPTTLPSATPVVSSTSAPSDSFSITEEPTSSPSAAPVVVSSTTSAPSDSMSTPSPTAGTTHDPSFSPSALPSSSPQDIVSSNPSGGPTISATSSPSSSPSQSSSLSPTVVPSQLPSRSSDKPTFVPSSSPSSSPSDLPTPRPSSLPSSSPSSSPSSPPSSLPSVSPSNSPSHSPSVSPSSSPTTDPTLAPSSTPSEFPTELAACAGSIVGTFSDTSAGARFAAFNWLVNTDTLASCENAGALMQRYVMAVFYYSLAGDSWRLNTNWLHPSRDVCVWQNVFCGGGDDINKIQLSSDNLTGTIPPELAQLTALEQVDLRDNGITGSLPSELGVLSLLQKLDVSQNQLTGTVPTEVCNLFTSGSLNELSGDSNPSWTCSCCTIR